MFALTKQIKSQEERKMLEEFEFLMESIWDNATVIIKEDQNNDN